MKKFRIKYTSKRGNEHEATVVLDDQTAKALLATGDKKLLHDYLLSVHKENKQNRVEEYWCRSLEEDLENGIDYAANEENEEKGLLEDIENPQLKKAIEGLTEYQKIVLKLRFQDELTMKQIADTFGVTQQAITDMVSRIIEKIRKNF